MNMKALKVMISIVCAIVAGIHLIFPMIGIDAVTLGLLAIGLLPWFQPLVKSLELPGGLKIELQDVKAATDQIAGSPEILPQTGTDDLSIRESSALTFFGNVAEQDPNLALVGLRIEVEKLVVEIAESANLATEGRGVVTLLSELSRHSLVPQTVARGLTEFIVLGNQAAHGATVSKEAAVWALNQAPQLLAVLAAIRSNSVIRPQVLSAEIPKAEILAAHEQQEPIDVRFEKPFIRPPHVTVGFYGLGDEELSSGALQATATDKHGFKVHVVSMPSSHSVITWAAKWKATGDRK